MRVDRRELIVHRGSEVEFPANLEQPNDAIAAAIVSALPYDGKEHLFAVAMNTRGEPLAYSIVATGTVDSCPLYPRDIYAWAVTVPLARFVAIAHNHPSGKVDPSEPDKKGTGVVAAAGRIIGLDLLWSIVVTHESPAWANIPIEQGKQGKVGGDDEQTKRPEDTEPAEPAEPEDGDETEPEESGIDTDEHGESDGHHVDPATEEDLKQALGRLLGKAFSGEKFTCKHCKHEYIGERLCPHCGR